MHQPFSSLSKELCAKFSMDYIKIAIAFFFSFLSLCYFFRNKNGLPTNWPIIGMLPALLINVHNLNDYLVETMEKAKLNFLFKGPWFSNMHLLVSVDPINVHHIMSKNFDNYPKGSKLKEIFDIFGDSIINSDYSLWQYHRKLATMFLGHPHFHTHLVKKVWEKVEIGLIPILNHVSKEGLEIDLQDLFGRFTFDIICSLVVDYDPRSLSLDFPSVPLANALDEVEEVFFYRHIVPTYVWKFQRWLGVGQEKKYKNAWKIIDNYLFKYVNLKKLSKGNKGIEEGVDLMTLYMEESESAHVGKDGDEFLKNLASNYIIAGRDTTSTALSWFFYLLIKNPKVISKIREELASLTMHVNEKERYSYLLQNFEELIDKLVYLHGALCEALRLYPPVAFEARSPLKPDILPSGHQVDSNTQIIFNLYAMGRIKSIWGEDCNEFKPERWICKNGKLKHEPSYKFFSFNAGPRACLGKNMAFFQMKVVAITVIQNYHIQAVDAHQVIPNLSIISHMKHGFKVKVCIM